VPESPRHLDQRMALYQTLRRWFGDRAHVGSDQFVYWDPTDPRQCCAPDIFVRLGPRNDDDCWKAWIRGAPQLAIEIRSRSDRADEPWETKLRQYHRLGILELVCFDWNHRSTPLRIWDRIEEDLVERDPSDPDFHHCDVLEAFWIVRRQAEGRTELRLSHDPQGIQLFPTFDEEIRDRDKLETALEEARSKGENEQRRREEAERELARLRAEFERLRKG
jgi:Uma2 family endonuclease